MSFKSDHSNPEALTLAESGTQDLSFSSLLNTESFAAGEAQRSGSAECVSPKAEAPRMVIRGESLEIQADTGETFKVVPRGSSGKAKVMFIPKAKADGEPWAAFTDFLNISFPFAPSQANLIELNQYFGQFLGETFAGLEERKGGLHGYQKSFKIGQTGGLLAFGGQSGTAFVSLPGSACSLIQDWHGVYHLFHDIIPNARITRWDGTVDVFDGDPSIDDALRFYQAGWFNAGGNKPRLRQIGNWTEIDGAGRTVYVGTRRNGKLLRVYEKGKQLGDESSPWVRWELEMRRQDREIPWDVILEPGKYLAASYPCMSWVSEIQERIETLQKSAKISYQHLVYYARQAYGPLFNVMLKVEGGPEQVIQRLHRSGVPSRLDLGDSSLKELIAELLATSSNA